MRQKSELAFSVAIVCLAAFWLWEARNLPPTARLFPWTIGIPVLILAIVQLVQATIAIVRPAPKNAQEPALVGPTVATPPDESHELDFSSADALAATATAELESIEPPVDPDVARNRAITMCIWIVAFFAALVLLGFRVGAPLITFLFLRFASKESVRLSLAFAVPTYLFLLLADLTHMVTLSTGLLAQQFGSEPFDAYLVNPILRLVRPS